jgi:hypothetical protein
MRMITRAFFRTIVSLGFIVEIFADIIDSLKKTIFPSDLLNYISSHPTGYKISPLALFVIAAGCIILNITIFVGLLMFWRPARMLTLISCLLDVVLASFINPTIEPGAVIGFDYLSMLITGMIIGLVYFSPVKGFFEKTGQNQPVQ